MTTLLQKKGRLFMATVASLTLGFFLSHEANAATIVGGVITVAPGDVSLDQDVSGFDYRWEYNTTNDEYYQNGNYGTAEATGWANAVVYSERAERGTDGTPAAWLYRDSNGGGPPTIYEWAFDFSGSGYFIEGLKVQHAGIIYTDGGGNAVNKIEWAISTDDGVSWTEYFELLGSDITGGNVFDAALHDLTSLVPAGTQTYRLRATMTYNWSRTKVQILRNDPWFSQNYGDYLFDNQVWLTAIPEPSSLLLLGIGTLGLFTLNGRRRERK